MVFNQYGDNGPYGMQNHLLQRVASLYGCFLLDWIGLKYSLQNQMNTLYIFQIFCCQNHKIFFKLGFSNKWMCQPAPFAGVDTNKSLKKLSKLNSMSDTHFVLLLLKVPLHRAQHDRERSWGVVCFFIFVLLFCTGQIIYKLSSVTVAINSTSWIPNELAGKD